VRRSRVVSVALAALTAAAAVVTVTGVATPALAALSGNWYGAAPYVMPLDNNPPDLSQVMAATGQKSFELAFILAPNGGGCSPTWDGTTPLSSDGAVVSAINTVRAGGGDVSVSAGGYGGTKLGQTCGSPQATADAYQQVVNRYGLRAIDFDLEEPEYENATAIANELGAAQILQRNNPGLYVSITTAGTASGTGWFGQQLLNNAKSLGFTPNNYAIMPFDGGFNGSASQISALEAFHSILMNTFGWDGATAYAHEGFSGMNGRSDSGEYFYQSDFQNVLNYATGHGLSRFTYWSVNRDRQCSPPDNNGVTSGVCSSVAQGAWDFTRYTAQFAGSAPPPPPPPPTTGYTVIGPGGKCLDVAGDDTGGNGTPVQLWDCQSWAVDQHWLLKNGELQSLGRCLDVIDQGTAAGSRLQLWDCWGGPNQKWVTRPNGTLVNVGSGRCLDAPYGNTANGTQLWIWDCNGSGAQTFSYNGGSSNIIGPAGKCVDVAGDEVAGDGAAVQLWDCQDRARDQNWAWSGSALTTMGMCLDIAGGGTGNGTPLQLHNCTGNPAQVWIANPNGTLSNPQSGRCIDSPGGNIANGTRLQIWDCNGTGAQTFAKA
jgi:chitinase